MWGNLKVLSSDKDELMADKRPMRHRIFLSVSLMTNGWLVTWSHVARWMNILIWICLGRLSSVNSSVCLVAEWSHWYHHRLVYSLSRSWLNYQNCLIFCRDFSFNILQILFHSILYYRPVPRDKCKYPNFDFKTVIIAVWLWFVQFIDFE